MSETPKSHQQRAEAAVEIIRTARGLSTRAGETTADMIARETFPAELVKAIRKYRDWTQKVTRTSEIPYAVTMELETALVLYGEEPTL